MHFSLLIQLNILVYVMMLYGRLTALNSGVEQWG